MTAAAVIRPDRCLFDTVAGENPAVPERKDGTSAAGGLHCRPRRSVQVSADSQHYQVVDGVLARPVDDTIVLFQPETERLLTLNACGARIWNLLTEGADVAQIIAQLAEEFEGPESMIQQQTVEFLAQLQGEEIIRPA